jgi:hypothetical protein
MCFFCRLLRVLDAAARRALFLTGTPPLAIPNRRQTSTALSFFVP